MKLFSVDIPETYLSWSLLYLSHHGLPVLSLTPLPLPTLKIWFSLVSHPCLLTPLYVLSLEDMPGDRSFPAWESLTLSCYLQAWLLLVSAACLPLPVEHLQLEVPGELQIHHIPELANSHLSSLFSIHSVQYKNGGGGHSRLRPLPHLLLLCTTLPVPPFIYHISLILSSKPFWN